MKLLLAIVAVIITLIATVNVINATTTDCSKPCNATVCLHPVCGTAGPYRCQSGNVKCYLTPEINATCTQGCCDVTSGCATQSCEVTCPQSVCDAAAPSCPSASPWICLKGQGKGGCNSKASAFVNNSACGGCCNINTCPSKKPTNIPPPPTPTNSTPSTPTPAPSQNFSCSGQCNQTVCDETFRCADAQPYECTSGRSAGGCATNPSVWPSAPAFCQSCCDVRTCQTKCTVCPKSQCFAPVCAPAQKYTCTAGADKNGCAASASYWSKNPGCKACCYCPSGLLNGLEHP